MISTHRKKKSHYSDGYLSDFPSEGWEYIYLLLWSIKFAGKMKAPVFIYWNLSFSDEFFKNAELYWNDESQIFYPQ